MISNRSPLRSSHALWCAMPDEELYIGPTALSPGPRDADSKGHRLAEKIFIPLLVLFVGVVLVFYVFFDKGRISGPSMLPTLHDKDMVLLTKGYHDPQRGDIIFTAVDEQGQAVEIVKRVIGLPGDSVEIRKDNAIVNGVPEPARGQYVDPNMGDTIRPYVVPQGYLYVMGDNRPNSEDSRYIGPVPIAGVMGRVMAIYAPITRIGRVR